MPDPDEPTADAAGSADDAADPGREDAVRRLLAEARHDAGVPDDVVARLDGRLAGLVAERRSGAEASAGVVEGTGADAPVSDLSTHRRRRLRAGAAVLVAAAAVVVIGVGVGIGGPTPDGEDSGAGSSSADRQTTQRQPPEARSSDRSDADAGPGAGRTGDPSPPSVQDEGRVPALRVREARFVADVRFVRDRVGADDRADYQGTVVREPPGFRCTTGPYGRGVLVGVRYEGGSGVLAFRAPTSDTQVADLLQCGTGEILRSTTLPLR